MRLGLVTDVHSQAAELARALALFRERRVDQVVTIGDTIDAFAPPEGTGEVAELLLQANAVGVWGNHDFALRGDVSAAAKARFPQAVFAFMARMQPSLVLGNCHFSHKEGSVDPYDAAQLWEVSDRPLDLVARAALGFQAVRQSWQFVGHYHRWWAAMPSGQAVWEGGEPLLFSPMERYFVVVGPVCEGWCGLLDLENSLLEPLSCSDYHK
jgi:predicted phosphodiesterase